MTKPVQPLKKNDTLTLEIAALSSEGHGVGRVGGFAVFVPGALPGETVEAHVVKVTPSYAIAKMQNLLSASKMRVCPACEVAHMCGGCSLQHLQYAAQLEAKKTAVADALLRIGGLQDATVLQPLGMQTPWGYRNKGSFPLGEAGGRVVAGFFAPRSHRLVEAPHCPVHHPAITGAVRCVCRWANELHLSAYDEKSKSGLLRHVVARAASTGELMVAVVSRSGLNSKQAKLLAEMLKSECPETVSIINNINPHDTNVIQGCENRLLYGTPTLKEHISGLEFKVGLGAFLQVNHSQTEALYDCVISALAPAADEHVLDVYCGIGTMSLLIARHAGRVTGLELVEEAVQNARENAVLNRISNTKFIAGDAKLELPVLAASSGANAVVLDPPRKGCAPEVLKAVEKSGAGRIVYVSCNPATLARDCKVLAEYGYVFQFAQPVDMFPHTPHVETVVLMSKVQN